MLNEYVKVVLIVTGGTVGSWSKCHRGIFLWEI